MQKDILYIVIPAYNEEENIARVIEDWYPIIEMYKGGGEELSRLVIIDDGSTDKTYSIIKKYVKEKNNLLLYTKKIQDTVQRFFMGIITPWDMAQIIFFRLIRMDRLILVNFMNFGKCVKNMRW